MWLKNTILKVNCSSNIHLIVHLNLEQKKTPKVLLPLGFLNFVGTKRVLHSHSLVQ